MAQTEQAAPATPRRHRPRTAPIRMDMTPMVDLAFLLLTFFILTTTLRRIEAMDLVVPLGQGTTASDNTITFLLSGRDSIFGYAGTLKAGGAPQRYGLDQVRIALAAVPDTSGIALLVKIASTAQYANVVGLLDEFALRGLRRYSIQDALLPEERAALGQQP
jgi:biopolymer transport protein ExbD